MARPRKYGVKYKVNVQLGKYDYDFLERNATRYGFSKSEVMRQIINYYRDKSAENAVVANLEDESYLRLNEIASKRGMSVGELASRIIDGYLRI